MTNPLNSIIVIPQGTARSRKLYNNTLNMYLSRSNRPRKLHLRFRDMFQCVPLYDVQADQQMQTLQSRCEKVQDNQQLPVSSPGAAGLSHLEATQDVSSLQHPALRLCVGLDKLDMILGLLVWQILP